MNGWIATIKLSRVGPVSYKDFYSSLSSIITRDEYEQFLHLFKKNDCTTMGHWLRVYNVANVVPFIFETFRRMTGQCYPDKVDVCKGAVSIPGTSMTHALNKSLEKTKSLSYIHQEAFVTYVEINEKSSSTVVVTVIVKNVS